MATSTPSTRSYGERVGVRGCLSIGTRVPLTRAFGATSPRKRGEVKDLLHVRDVIGQLRNLLRRHRPHHVGHGAVIAVAGVVLVFGKRLGEVILALVGNARDVLGA